MCDNFWEPLAEIYIADREASNPDDYIYCLCSRVFIRNPEVYTVLASEDASEGEDADGDYVGEMLDLCKGSGVETQSLEKHDEEPVSCYCSASHTDNNYSTDEHDSVRDSAHWPTAHSLTQKLGLHQSDSGADLSEYHDQHEAKSIQNLVASYGKTFQTIETEVENNDENVNMLTEFEHVSGDHKESSAVQNLSDSTTILNTKGHDKDLIIQYDYNSYAYPYSADYGSNKNAVDVAWEKFWAKQGEQLIWASWIEKYADYINPEYFQNNACTTEDEKLQDAEINEVAIERYFEQNTCFPSQAHKNCELVRSNFAGIFNKSYSSDSELKPAAVSSSNTSFSFEQVSRQEVHDKDADENRKKILNFEMSPEDGDGWNPLSPLSIEENYNHHSNAEDERLLMRCDSVNGSITKTNATSDSMTNVTKMTLTSSSCDSNSVHSSSLLTSVTSSIESSMTSSSSDQENEFSVEDNDKYWQHLWKENFETQYQKQYELFTINYKKQHNIDYNQLDFNTSKPCHLLNESYNNSNILQQEEVALQDRNNEDLLGIYTCEDKKHESMDTVQTYLFTPNKVNAENKNLRKGSALNSKSKSSEKLKTQRLIMDSVGVLMKNLTIKVDEDDPTDVAEEVEMHEKSQQVHTEDSIITENEMEIVASNSNFNSSHQQKSSDGGDEFHEEVQEFYRQSHKADCNDNEDGLETVKKAFSLMGYANLIENDSQRKLQGEVVYRKRNIRRQSFQLMAELKRLKPRYKSTLDDAETPIRYTNKTNKYVSCDSAAIPTEIDVQSNDKGSYTKVQSAFTSSSDDEDNIKMMQRKKRRKQFKRYEDGIKLDRESWFSVTPEEIAKDIAARCRCDTIIDAFCGAGSNAIQFAFTCERVIAIDIDPNKIKIARHNAGIYGVEDRIEFIIGDFLQLAPQLVADVVFLSPPWGGPDYIKKKVFDLESIMFPIGGRNIFEAARRITQHVAYYLPRNSDPLQIIMLTEKYDKVEIQQNMFNGKFTACTAYYGELART
ncbi:PREDICTED: uncharacterized protein LOC108775532 isoform X2 [Cyphomyrmex costatus]|uniref:uncharacterized protein LOC108775532 isoform X2 n=1 Tax=Cyphomyrmex costatus TaxID=456900 RepID=UPI0008523FAE|nr:PREDICTED: uncharacterized protein LOC108775532 isoform X2 [Cyphomyrmex costatus]